MTINETVPETTAALQALDPEVFQIACRQAAALMNRPEFDDKLTCAMDLVLAGKVTLLGEESATVQSGAKTYHLEPECTCKDSQHRTLYCKHFLAVALLRKTCERLGMPGNGNGHVDPGQAAPGHTEPSEPVPEPDDPFDGLTPPWAAQPDPVPPKPHPEPWTCAQAPSSCTLKWRVNEIELLLTLRAGTDQELFNRIGKVLPRIEEKLEAQRQQREQERQQREAEASQAEPPEGAADGNGNGRSSPTTTTLPDDDAGWCERHEEPMYRHERDGDVWYSHRYDGKWCRGKK